MANSLTRAPDPSTTTLSAKLSPQTPPRAPARQSRDAHSWDTYKSPTSSPALSSASTADGEASPELPPLPAPRLPERVLGLLRTPPESPAGSDDTGVAPDGANPWGSPYPPNLRSRSSSNQSLSSDASEDSPIHRLELPTPFLRPAPPTQDSQPELRLPEISAAATVLANRARRIAHGITEGWIRQHTAGGTVEQEKRHWFSDGESENSSLSDSFSAEDAAWLGDDIVKTPKASRKKNSARSRQVSGGSTLGKQSSSETLRQANARGRKTAQTAAMASSDERATPDTTTESTPVARFIDGPSTPTVGREMTPSDSLTPSRAAVKRASGAPASRLKKKVAWKGGKNIMVLLPRDEERGQPGKTPIPLTEANTSGMLRSWQQLGYDIDGFDLYEPTYGLDIKEQSQSRGAWPDPGDLSRERKAGNWRVLLPDLNGMYYLVWLFRLVDDGANIRRSMETICGRSERGEAPRARGFVWRRRAPSSAFSFPSFDNKQAGFRCALPPASLLPAHPDIFGIEQPGGRRLPVPAPVHVCPEPRYPGWRVAHPVWCQVQSSRLDFDPVAACVVAAIDAAARPSRWLALARQSECHHVANLAFLSRRHARAHGTPASPVAAVPYPASPIPAAG